MFVEGQSVKARLWGSRHEWEEMPETINEDNAFKNIVCKEKE